MKKYIRRDVIPSVIVFVLMLLLGKGFFWKMLTFIPILFYLLNELGIEKVQSVYYPKAAEYNSAYNQSHFWTEMKTYPHPIIMPKALYGLQAFVFFMIGLALFWLYPVNMYFWNWAKISKDMMEQAESASSSEQPAHNHRHQTQYQPRPPKAPQPAPNVSRQTTYAPPGSGPKPAPQPAKPWASARQMAALTEIERNDRELQQTASRFSGALDTVFGDSRMTKQRFQAGMDQALKMSADNLANAKAAIRMDASADIMDEYLARSNAINRKTDELLDGLIRHHQKQSEDDLNQLNDSLDELTRSIELYQ